MPTIKKGNSAIDVVFVGKGQYTNHLLARNIALENDVLKIDYSHYSKNKQKNLEGSDFDKLLRLKGSISHIVVADSTVKKHLKNTAITSFEIQITETEEVKKSVRGYDESSGFVQ